MNQKDSLGPFVFISGEKIDICAPEETDLTTWSSWFNSSVITRYLPQGRLPNSIQAQRRFLDNAIDTGRFIGMIKSKDGQLLGVISLSEINIEKGSAQISYVIPVRHSSAPLASLEAKALVSQHAFDQIGVDRIWAGHHYPGLDSWSRRSEILGYRTEAFRSQAARQGRSTVDTIEVALQYHRYQQLCERRGGRLWPSEQKAMKMIRAMKEIPSLASQVRDAITDLHQERDDLIDRIEFQDGVE